MKKKKVLIGMSGGVESSVAAYLLKKQGYDVTGITMKIWDGEYKPSDFHSCYGPNEKEEIEEATEICKIIGIPFHLFDCSVEYKKIVLEDFKSEYLAGRTPNPCVKCNQKIKFGLLPDLAERSGLDYDFFATGHYANVEFDAMTGRYILKTARDNTKDQTYFLYRLSQNQLSRLLLPLGNLVKTEVKNIARDMINMNEKKESQNFYAGNYKEILNVIDSEGKIVDKDGKVLGKHIGIWNYTIGQRKKIDVNTTQPLYVVSVDKEKNTITVGQKGDLLSNSFVVNDLNWISISELKGEMDVKVKIRSAHIAKEASIKAFEGNAVLVIFKEPVEAITPGQSAVFYSLDKVVGGGIISRIMK